MEPLLRGRRRHSSSDTGAAPAFQGETQARLQKAGDDGAVPKQRGISGFPAHTRRGPGPSVFLKASGPGPLDVTPTSVTSVDMDNVSSHKCKPSGTQDGLCMTEPPDTVCVCPHVCPWPRRGLCLSLPHTKPPGTKKQQRVSWDSACPGAGTGTVGQAWACGGGAQDEASVHLPHSSSPPPFLPSFQHVLSIGHVPGTARVVYKAQR